MAVTANTNETYDVSTIREDLADAMASISPTETIFMSTIGTRNVDNTYFEWSEVDLAAAATNNQIEGDAGLSNDAPTNAVRKGNYTAISAKVVMTIRRQRRGVSGTMPETRTPMPMKIICCCCWSTAR